MVSFGPHDAQLTAVLREHIPAPRTSRAMALLLLPWCCVTNQGTGRAWGQITLQPQRILTVSRAVAAPVPVPKPCSCSLGSPRCPAVARGGPSSRGVHAASVWSSAIWMYLQQSCSNREKIKTRQANLESQNIFGIFEDCCLKPDGREGTWLASP